MTVLERKLNIYFKQLTLCTNSFEPFFRFNFFLLVDLEPKLSLLVDVINNSRIGIVEDFKILV